ALILIGETRGHLGASLYLREIEGREAGPPPPVDLAAERGNGDFVRAMIEAGHVAACHDISDGGLLVALAEMAMAGGAGAAIDAAPADIPANSPLPGPPPHAGEGRVAAHIPAHAWWFGEDQARYLIETADPASVLQAAANARICAQRIGTVENRGHDAA